MIGDYKATLIFFLALVVYLLGVSALRLSRDLQVNQPPFEPATNTMESVLWLQYPLVKTKLDNYTSPDLYLIPAFHCKVVLYSHRVCVSHDIACGCAQKHWRLCGHFVLAWDGLCMIQSAEPHRFIMHNNAVFGVELFKLETTDEAHTLHQFTSDGCRDLIKWRWRTIL